MEDSKHDHIFSQMKIQCFMKKNFPTTMNFEAQNTAHDEGDHTDQHGAQMIFHLHYFFSRACAKNLVAPFYPKLRGIFLFKRFLIEECYKSTEKAESVLYSIRFPVLDAWTVVNLPTSYPR